MSGLRRAAGSTTNVLSIVPWLPFTDHVTPPRQTYTPKTSAQQANLPSPHLYRVHPQPLSLNSHTPTPSSQLPLSSPSTSTPPPQSRHLRAETDCALSGPGPAWQLAPPVRLCAHPLSQRIRIAFPMGGGGAVVLALPQYHRSSIVPPLAGGLMGPQPLAPANWCVPLLQWRGPQPSFSKLRETPLICKC